MRHLFPGQQDDEEIVLVVRQHWFYLTAKILIWLVFVAVLFAFDYYTPLVFPALLSQPALSYVNLMKNIYMMFLVLGLFMVWTVHYLNVWIVTNRRIVNVLQGGIFSQRISEMTLPKIEDITSETSGIFGTFFSFGNVEVQTAGEKDRFIFKNIPAPKDIERLIFNLSERGLPLTPPLNPSSRE